MNGADSYALAGGTRPLEGQRVAMLHESTVHGDMRVVRQVEELVAQGAAVTVWCPSPGVSRGQDDAFVLPGAEFRHRTSLGPSSDERPVEATVEAVAEFERWATGEIADWSPSVLAHHHPETLPLGVGLASQLDLPLVSDFNDMPPEVAWTRRFGFLPRRPWKFYPSRATDVELRRLYPRAAARITVAPGLAEELGRRYGVKDPHVVLNVPRIRRSSTPHGDRARPTLREHLALEDGDRLMVYVGHVNPRRNVEALLATLVESPGWHLAIVGSAQWRLEKFGLWEKIPASDRKRVHIVETQHESELPSFLASADCGVFIPQALNFNLYNCAPNKFFAMALAGIPVVVTELPFLAGEVARLGIGVSVRSTQSAVVRDALERAVAMKEEVRSLQPKVADEYAWERQAERLLAAYSEAIFPG